MAKYVITHVGDRFCELVESEKEARAWVSQDGKLAAILHYEREGGGRKGKTRKGVRDGLCRKTMKYLREELELGLA